MNACLLECQDLSTGKFYRRYKNIATFEKSKAAEQATQNDILLLEDNLVKHNSEKHKFRFIHSTFLRLLHVYLSHASCLNVGLYFTENYFLVWDFIIQPVFFRYF